LISERKGINILRKGIRVFKLKITMKLDRYENVERVVKILDIRILALLKNDKMNIKDLNSLIQLRSIYVKELDGLNRSMNTKKMYEKKNG